jgi:excisionase family DNA binding protein
MPSISRRSGCGAQWLWAGTSTVLRLSKRTIREYLQRGEIEGRIIGGRWRFRRADLDAFFGIRHTALDTAFKLRGSYAPRDPKEAAQFGVKVIVVDVVYPKNLVGFDF